MKELSRRTLLAGATALGATAIAPGSTAPVRAAAPPAGKQAAAFYRYKVGDFEITAINDGVWLPDVAAGLFKNFSVEDAQKALADQFQRTDKMVVPFTPLMVNTGSKLVLIDTGTAGMFVPTAASFMANLTAAGFDPKQVDTVVISHFHGDHINGIRTKDGQLVFPNAEVMVPAPEWAHWMDDAKMNATPEAGRGNFNNSRRVFGSIANNVTAVRIGQGSRARHHIDSRTRSHAGPYRIRHFVRQSIDDDDRRFDEQRIPVRAAIPSGRSASTWTVRWPSRRARSFWIARPPTRCWSPDITGRFLPPATSRRKVRLSSAPGALESGSLRIRVSPAPAGGCIAKSMQPFFRRSRHCDP